MIELFPVPAHDSSCDEHRFEAKLREYTALRYASALVCSAVVFSCSTSHPSALICIQPGCSCGVVSSACRRGGNRGSSPQSSPPGIASVLTQLYPRSRTSRSAPLCAVCVYALSVGWGTTSLRRAEAAFGRGARAQDAQSWSCGSLERLPDLIFG